MNKNILKYLLYVLSLAFVLTSCGEDEDLILSESENFVSFDLQKGALAEMAEDGSAIEVKVIMAYARATDTKVILEVTPADGTVEGVDFNVPVKEVIIPAGAFSTMVTVEPVDNDIYNKGSRSFTVSIVSVEGEGVSLLANNVDAAWTVNIKDNEHPLAVVLGDYEVTAVSAYAEDPFTYNASISPDTQDESKVWLSNFFDFGFAAVEGTVDIANGTITIKMGQKLGDHPDYGEIKILGEGDVLVGTFDENGTITFDTPTSATVAAGNFEKLNSSVWTKQ
ncbi:hypothetical protein V6R21_26365 [Limibacter armeniacum]|uniref:hypothetical protein n=1 Tax=Limibacter armeniacum TaxID=466084 RepID=UPI002FE5FC6E